MKPYYDDGKGIVIYNGDNASVMPTLAENSVDAIVTDPPYGISFMGKRWDYDIPTVDQFAECLRVLKPGGHLLCFCGTRTQHRMAVNIEDAGFEMRDVIAWVYGSGFPKSLDVGKAIDKLDAVDVRTERQLRFTEWMRSTGLTGRQIDELTQTNMGGHYLTAASQPAVATRELFELLRPAIPVDVPKWVEQLVNERTVESENFKRREVLKEDKRHRSMTSWESTGMLAEGEQDFSITAPATEAAKQWDGWGTALKPSMELITVARKPLIGTVAANVLKYGTGALNVDACRIGTEDVLERPLVDTASWHGNQWGANPQKTKPGQPIPKDKGRWPANTIHDGSEEVCELFPETVSGGGNKSRVPREGGYTAPSCYGTFADTVRPESYVDPDSGSASRFFQTCEYGESELHLCAAKAILSAWNHDLANTADDSTNLPSGRVVSALNDAAILASHGRLGLSELREHSTLATPRELRRLCEAAIAAILSIEKSAWQEQQRERHIGNGCRVKYVEAKKQIGTTTITISHWKSDGSAGNVTLSITQPCLDHGEAGSASRFRYTAKADKTDRDGTKHPTVKPIDLMRYLVRLVCPVGGIVLDPWCGSGTTVYAARAEHCKAIGIERELEYVTDAANRLRQGVLDFGGDV